MAKKRNKARDGIMSRYKAIFFALAVFSLAIVGRLAKTVVWERDGWNAAADSTLTQTVEVMPERGSILAADGSLLAVTVRHYDVRMDFRAAAFDEKALTDTLSYLCDSLAVLLPKHSSAEWMRRFNEQLSEPEGQRSRTFLIDRSLTHQELARLKGFPYFSSRNGRATLSATQKTERVNPYGRMAYRSIGRVVEDSTGIHGTSGLEGALDSLLFGKRGRSSKVQLTNGIRFWEEIAPQRGYDIKTTIDVRIQDIVESELYDMCMEVKPEWATAVLMEVATGDIKAMSNLTRTSKGDYTEQINNAFMSWELGSVMKPISLMIAIEDKAVDPDTHISIERSFSYAHSRPITDSHSIGPDPTVTDVLAGSSNIGTAKIITGMFGGKPWEFRTHLADIGFFDRLNVGVTDESAPIIQDLGSPGVNFRNEWNVNLSRCCYGYAVAMPPILNLAIINAIANDGAFVRPRLVSELWQGDSLCESRPVDYVRRQMCSPATARAVRDMLKAVVWSEKSHVPTAPRLRNNFVTIAGKTGTSFIHKANVGYTHDRRLTFCGFFPYESPRYSCIVVFNAPDSRSAQNTSGRVLMNVALKLYARGLLGNVSDFRADTPSGEAEPATLMGMPAGKSSRLTEEFGIASRRQYETKPAGDGKVPSVVGMGLRDAVATLERAGLSVGSVSGSGYVGTQSPAAGTPLRKGENVNLQLTNW